MRQGGHDAGRRRLERDRLSLEVHRVGAVLGREAGIKGVTEYTGGKIGLKKMRETGLCYAKHLLCRRSKALPGSTALW